MKKDNIINLFWGIVNDRQSSSQRVHDAMENLKDPLQRAIDAFNIGKVNLIASNIKTATNKLNIFRDALNNYAKYRKESIGYDDLAIREEDVDAIGQFVKDARIKLEYFKSSMHGSKNKGAIKMAESKLADFSSTFSRFEEELNDALSATKEYKQAEKYRVNHKEEIFENQKSSIRDSLKLSKILFYHEEMFMNRLVHSVIERTPANVVRGFLDNLETPSSLPDFFSTQNNKDVDSLTALSYLWHYNTDPLAPKRKSLSSELRSALPDVDPFSEMDVAAFKRDVASAFKDVYGEDIDVVPKEKPKLFHRKVADFLIITLLSMFEGLRNDFMSILINDPTSGLKKKFFEFLENQCMYSKSIPTWRTFYNRFDEIKDSIKHKKCKIAKNVAQAIENINHIMTCVCSKPFFAKPFFA